MATLDFLLKEDGDFLLQENGDKIEIFTVYGDRKWPLTLQMVAPEREWPLIIS